MKTEIDLTEGELRILQNMFELYNIIAEQERYFNYNVRSDLFYLKEKLNSALGLNIDY